MNSRNHPASARLRNKILSALRSQGFRVDGRNIRLPDNPTKETLRELHATAVRHHVASAGKELIRKEGRLLDRLASGDEVEPPKIAPSLIEVEPSSEDSLLFRYASLHWSIPVSAGYGRRIRFLVIDKYNDKLMGIIGLADPVFNLGPRDKWIGWTPESKKSRLRNIMDAFVLGAVPPYSYLLCGKLIALLATSTTVRNAFERKYLGKRSIINKAEHDGQLALLTTTSALGRSSVYNRLRFGKGLEFKSVGFTQGSGDFHFANGLYSEIANFALESCTPTAKHSAWGTGFRNRREVVRKSLRALGLPSKFTYHNIRREIFVASLARNTKEFLRGEDSKLTHIEATEEEIFEFFRDRWLMPRAKWDNRFKSWSKQNWVLWECNSEPDSQHVL